MDRQVAMNEDIECSDFMHFTKAERTVYVPRND